MNELLKRLKDIIKGPKALMIIGIIGVALIGLSSFIPSDNKNIKEETDVFDAEEYRDHLQNDIALLVQGITGDKNCTVVITLESGVRYTYADTNEKEISNSKGNNTEENSSGSTKSYITVKDSDGGESPLIVTEIMPKVRGVAIVCKGGNDKAIIDRIVGSVTAALDITSKKVNVSGGNSYEKR